MQRSFIAPGGSAFRVFDGAPFADKPSGANSGPSVSLTCGADLSPEPIEWLWCDWLAVGKLHLLAGAPGSGKTTIALALAASLTSGGNWPDGGLIDAGNVLLWSGEDGVKDTLLPRFLSAGGDSKRLLFVAGAQQDGRDGQFDPSRHMAALEEVARVHLPKLLILDPVVSAVAADSHKNTEVRRGLQPVVDLAERLGCAVLGITHLSKNTAGRDPLERISGSIAFGAVARVALATVKPADSDAPRRLVRAKSNIGPDTGGFEYRLFSAPVPGHDFNAQAVEWGQPLDGTARELMAVEEPADEADTEDATAFLTGELRAGPVPTKDLKSAAAAHGYSWRTLQRVKQTLGIEAVKLGMKEGWAWKLPPNPLAAEERHEVYEERHKI
jgi:putative DNA primase/helicase